MNIGQAIKTCRVRKGMTQVELARLAECSVSYLSMLEKADRDPSLSTIEKIANALKIPVTMLFFLGAEGDELKGIDRNLQGQIAMTALELLSHSNGNDKA